MKKLVNKIKDLLEGQFQKPLYTEAGNTSVDAAHWHKHAIDIHGNGKTIDSRPRDYVEDHVHEIKNYIALPLEEDGHTHKVEA